ncbi:MAG: PCRF domain-containing protein, partial [Sciscionella sp.]
MNADVSADLKDLSTTLSSVEAVMDVEQLRAQVAELEEQSARPDLWDDQEHAQKVNTQLAYKQGDLRRVTDLRQRLDDLSVLYELADEEDDPA